MFKFSSFKTKENKKEAKIDNPEFISNSRHFIHKIIHREDIVCVSTKAVFSNFLLVH